MNAKKLQTTMIRGINYIDNSHYECDLIQDNYTNIYIYDLQTLQILPALNTLKTSPHVVFSVRDGMYVLKNQLNNNFVYNIKRKHIYPYQRILRCYGADTHLNIFSKTTNTYLKTQKIKNQIFSSLCPFTFGIEYETSIGAIPEEECFEKGLIPLRDGSITGNEYTTPVLSGDKGLFLINQQINLLNQYTDFNRDCALHIHFGGFPLDKNAILALNNLCTILVSDLLDITPAYTFATRHYKANGKDYCKPLDWYSSFEEMFLHLTNMPFLGDFYQPHPNDLEKKAKWNIPTRYHMCNFINLLCYNSNKTIEFRFLKPTKNSHVLYFWLYILNAIMLYAIKYKNLPIKQMRQLFGLTTVKTIIADVYPADVANALTQAVNDMFVLRTTQRNNGDNCGEFTHFENNFKLSKLLINYE